MNILRVKSHLADEKKIIYNCVYNDTFLSILSDYLKQYKYLLKSDHNKMILEWCLDFYSETNKAPKNQLNDYLYFNKDYVPDKDFEPLEKYVLSLKESEEKFNIDYELKKARNYIEFQKVIELKRKLEESIFNENIEEAQTSISEYYKTDILENMGVDVLSDTRLIAESIERIEDDSDVLFNFSGAAKEFFGDFCRGDFVSVLSPAKRGKTYMLQELAIRALEMGNKVLFISMEMTQKELIKRFWAGLLAKPLKNVGKIKIPYFIDNRIEYKEMEKSPITMNDVHEYIENHNLHYYKSTLKLMTFPMYSKSVTDLKSLLTNFEYVNNFTPDVLILDYADILIPEKTQNKQDYRHQINSIWIGLRNIAQDRNICVITASQSKVEATKRNLEQADAAEDKRKLAHVTKFFGINQTSYEKEKGILRHVMLEDRHREFYVHKELVSLECRKIGRIMLDTRMKDEIVNYKELTNEKEKD